LTPSSQNPDQKPTPTIDPGEFGETPDVYLEQFGPVWGKMRDIAASLLVNQYTAVRSATGTSKTHTAAGLMLWWLDTHRPHGRVISTAKTMKQVETVLWAQFRSMQIKVRHRFSGARPDIIQFFPDREEHPKWFAMGYNPKVEGTEATAFQGQHSETGHVLFVFEEANTIHPAIFAAAEGSLDAANARMLAIFNPNVARGVVHEWERDGTVSKKQGNLITISRYDLYKDPKWPELEALGGLPSKKRTDAMVKKYGKNSTIVRVKVFGEYPLIDADAAIPMDKVELAIDRFNEGFDIGRILQIVVAWDVAGEEDGGDDNSLGAIFVGEKGFLFKFLVPDWNCLHTQSELKVYGELEKLKAKYWKGGGRDSNGMLAGVTKSNHQSNGEESADGDTGGSSLPSIKLIVDAVGEGSHVPSHMNEKQPDIPTIGFKAGMKSEGVKEYPEVVLSNLISDAWYHARVLLLGDTHKPLAADIGEETVHELTSRKQVYTNKRGEPLVWAIESKDEWKSRNGGASPDRADVFVMACWGVFKGKKKKKFDWAIV